MAYSYTLVSGDGSTTTFAVPFGYLDRTHVGVKVNGTTTSFSWLTGSSISISPAPASGAIIEIRRTTPKTEPPVNFVDGSVLLEEALDKEALFNLYLAQEAYDGVQQSMLQNAVGVWDGQGRRATNFAAPTTSGDLVTKGYFDDTYGASIAASVAAAAGSASAAAGSASAAASSATQANDFRLRYQGSAGTAPTLRYDGTALQSGDLYFDTTMNTMKVFNGTLWVTASSAVNGIRAVFRYVATGGQTTFSGADTSGLTLAYDVGFANVYLNGFRLDRTDFTATNGTSIVLATGATAGDELNIEAFGTFNLANFSGAALQDGTVSLPKLVQTGQLPAYDGSKLTNLALAAGHFRNLAMSAGGTNANISVSYDSLVIGDGAGNFALDGAVSATINTTTTGAGGLDTGTLAASSWYSVWRIGKPDGTRAFLFSLSTSSPTMPSGYTMKARIGWFRTDSTANKYPLTFSQTGRKVQYTPGSGRNLTATPALATGAGGDTVTPVWLAVAIGNYVPPTSIAISVHLYVPNSGSAGVAPNGAYSNLGGGSPANPPPLQMAQSSGNAGGSSIWMNLESTNIYYLSVGGAYLRCLGWEDNL